MLAENRCTRDCPMCGATELHQFIHSATRCAAGAKHFITTEQSIPLNDLRLSTTLDATQSVRLTCKDYLRNILVNIVSDLRAIGVSPSLLHPTVVELPAAIWKMLVKVFLHDCFQRGRVHILQWRRH